MPSVNISRERSLYASFSEQSIQTRNRELARLQEHLGTGLRVNRPSDDPSNYGQARRMEVLKDRYEQYQRSISTAQTWTDHTQQAIDGLAEFFAEAYERGVRISNDTFSASDRKTFADRLQYILNSVPDILNQKLGDEYLFAGSKTTVPPFTTATPAPAGAVVDSAGYWYAGNEGGRERHIGVDQKLNVAINGSRLWDTGLQNSNGDDLTLTGALQDMIAALQGTGPITDQLENLRIARDHILNVGAEAGTIANRLTLAQNQLTDLSTLAEGARSDAEDTDLAQTMMDIQKGQVGLQAALKSTASILQVTLLDYLR